MPTTVVTLRRPERGRWLAGVAIGVAEHLRVPVLAVRATFLLLLAPAGAGAALYLFWWLTVPSASAGDGPVRPAALARLVRRQPVPAWERRVPLTDIGVGVLLVALAAVAWAARRGTALGVAWLVPALLVLGGLALAWSQLDSVQRRRVGRLTAGRTPAPVLAVVGGVLLAAVGALMFVGHVLGAGLAPGVLVQSVIAALAVLAGVGLALAPWWLRLVRELGDERAAREREAERADIAAHLHDSVLQTLALVRAHADDPVEVARMARAQERELREWLYADRPTPGTSLAAGLRQVVAEVEDSRLGAAAVAVDVVVVGDRVPDDDTAALLAATREALVNAVSHGRPPVSLYLEVRDDAVEVYVRDRGPGFDLADVPADRLGVRGSIIGRVRRRGGSAQVTSSADRGTEVHLVLPVRAPQ